jgi:cbb3-type cytochrome oxidase subunit 1
MHAFSYHGMINMLLVMTDILDGIRKRELVEVICFKGLLYRLSCFPSYISFFISYTSQSYS